MHHDVSRPRQAGGTLAEVGPARTAVASVVITAHDEAPSIARTVNHLLDGLWDDELELTVVCDGCTDDTSRRARRAAPEAVVLETARPSRNEAVRVGSASCTTYPRVHLDPDVVLDGPDLRRLVAPLRDGRVLAAAPRRVLVTTGCPLLVRWYCDVWQHLPGEGGGLVAGGAVALTERGQARADARPWPARNDLVAHELFGEEERVVVEDVTVLVHAPRHLLTLVREGRGAGSAPTWRSLARLLVRHPLLTPKVPAYLVASGLSRLLARDTGGH